MKKRCNKATKTKNVDKSSSKCSFIKCMKEYLDLPYKKDIIIPASMKFKS